VRPYLKNNSSKRKTGSHGIVSACLASLSPEFKPHYCPLLKKEMPIYREKKRERAKNGTVENGKRMASMCEALDLITN
jgi:hypothetical protein